MKKIAVTAAIVAAALILSSCYIMSAGSTGTIKLDFAGSLAKAATGSSNKVRIYLFGGGSALAGSLYTFPATGLDYTEASYPGTVTLAGVPAGQWQAAVAIGQAGGNGSFLTVRYGTSSPFSVEAGNDATVSITTSASPVVYSPQLEGISLDSVMAKVSYLNYGNTGSAGVFASSPSTLYGGLLSYSSTAGINLPSTSIGTFSGLPAGAQINSLGFGYTSSMCLFVNTTKGILPFNDAGNNAFDTSFLPSLGSSSDVLGSTADISGNTVLDYYASESGIGGIDVNPLSSWVTISLSGGSNSDPVYGIASDYAVGDGLLYAATKGGAFWAPASIVNPLSNPTGGLSGAHYFTAPNGETIESLATLFPVNASTLGKGLLYIGTPGGAFSAPITESSGSVSIGNFSPVSGTAGKKILAIATSTYPDSSGSTTSNYAAFRTNDGIIVLDESTGATTTYPFYAGFPGTVNRMVWANGRLLLAGSEGLAAIVIGPPGASG